MTLTEKQGNYSRADVWLFLCMSAYFVMNGAQLFETAVIIPAWTAAPPASLIFFQGPYGLDFKYFWIITHAVHEIIFILALIFNWKVRKRGRALLVLFIAHMAVRVWTVAYFAPTIMEFQAISPSNTIDPQLVEKALKWRNLNYLRVALFFVINIILVFLFPYQKEKTEK